MLPFDKAFFAESSRGGHAEEFEYVPSAKDVLEHCIPVYKGLGHTQGLWLRLVMEVNIRLLR